MKKGWFDAVGFYEALDSVRDGKGMNWKQVAGESGVSASTLTRMAQGKRPDVDGLAALVAWSGLDADQFIRAADRPEVDSLSQIRTYLRSDKSLTAESAIALDKLLTVAYKTLREKG